MALADHTFSFRAPTALADRMREAEGRYGELARDPETAGHIGREFELRLLRSLREARSARGQGAFMRAVLEAFVCATERAAQDEEAAVDLQKFDRADRRGAAERAALLDVSVEADPS